MVFVFGVEFGIIWLHCVFEALMSVGEVGFWFVMIVVGFGGLAGTVGFERLWVSAASGDFRLLSGLGFGLGCYSCGVCRLCCFRGCSVGWFGCTIAFRLEVVSGCFQVGVYSGFPGFSWGLLLVWGWYNIDLRCISWFGLVARLVVLFGV